MGLQHSYRFLAPIYDKIVAATTYKMRQKSIRQLGNIKHKKILIAGIGTGLDLPHLDSDAECHGIDITPAMMQQIPSQYLTKLSLCVGDVMNLPYKNNSFDIVILHLILAVVPNCNKMLTQISNITKSGGKVIILDKFITKNQTAYFRKLISPLLGLFVTRTDVIFESVLENCPELKLISNEACEFTSWFRHIELCKE